MRYRIISTIGLGNPDRPILPNTGKLNKKFAKSALEAYFSEFEGFDFQVSKNEILIGIEPAYQYEKLRVISINRSKSLSYIKTGKAWGPYGSGIAANIREYSQYKLNSKFIRFIDQWHPILFGAKK